MTLEEAKRRHVVETLEACGGNVSAAARVLDIARSSLQRMLRKWGTTKHAGELPVVRYTARF